MYFLSSLSPHGACVGEEQASASPDRYPVVSPLATVAGARDIVPNIEVFDSGVN